MIAKQHSRSHAKSHACDFACDLERAVAFSLGRSPVICAVLGISHGGDADTQGAGARALGAMWHADLDRPKLNEPSRMLWQGAACLYHCYLDESLNVCLKSLAMFCHRRTFPRRVHHLMDLQGRLGNRNFVSAGPWLPCLASPCWR
eukprot:9471033-Pyramimonas_sp.AAC.1